MARKNGRDFDDQYDEFEDDGYDEDYEGRGGEDYDGDDGYADDDRYAGDERYADEDRYADDDGYAGDERYAADDRYADDDGYDDPYADDDRYADDYEDVRPSRRGRSSRRTGRDYGYRDDAADSGKKKRRIILFAVEIAALIAVLLILYMVLNVSKVGKANLSQTQLTEAIATNVQQEAETGTMKGYRNIAFFGVDSTEGELDQNTRSDSIMICSINEDTGDVKLVSVYRDTFLNLGNDNYNKCNAAYAKGGPQQAINMLNSNLDMNITDFVTVGFGGLTDVINALGGIEIPVEEDEISHLNNYQSTMAKELGMDYTEVTEPGVQTLDGLQATAYCRIRYTKGWDYKRAARQREVLYAVMNKAKQANVSQLADIATNAFSEVYTSYSLDDLVKDVSSLAKYNVVEEENMDDMANGFPQSDLRIQANLGDAVGDAVVPRSLAENVQWLHQFLFDDESYQVSDTVQQYSDFIDQDTKDAVPEEMTDADHT